MSGMSAQRERARRLQAELEQHPRRYHGKLLAWALLGYAVPVLMLTLTLGLTLGLLLAALTLGGAWLLAALKLLWIPLLYGLILLRALWLRFTPPEGQVLSESQAPQLFAEVERMRLAAGAQHLEPNKMDRMIVSRLSGCLCKITAPPTTCGFRARGV